MKPARISAIQTLLIALVLPILGLIMGGIYLFPAVWLTKGREPWLTLLLAIALACTTLGFGLAVCLPLGVLLPIWAVCMLLLLGIRSLFGGLDRHVERFGFVHMAAVVILLCAPFLKQAETVADRPEGTSPSAEPRISVPAIPDDETAEPTLGVEADT